MTVINIYLEKSPKVIEVELGDIPIPRQGEHLVYGGFTYRIKFVEYDLDAKEINVYTTTEL